MRELHDEPKMAEPSRSALQASSVHGDLHVCANQAWYVRVTSMPEVDAITHIPETTNVFFKLEHATIQLNFHALHVMRAFFASWRR